LRAIIVGLVGGLLMSACAAGAIEQGDIFTPGASAGPNCPVTVPPQPGFVPPEPYPPEPSFDEVWYGTPELWTNLDPDGAVWRGLPVEPDGSVGDKTLWWSETFSTAASEDFTGTADITVEAAHLDGSAPKVVVEGGVPSFNRDIGNFMLVGLELPEPGCWEVTASYQGAKLAFVIRVT
jgi:hypothetical protein